MNNVICFIGDVSWQIVQSTAEIRSCYTCKMAAVRHLYFCRKLSLTYQDELPIGSAYQETKVGADWMQNASACLVIGLPPRQSPSVS